MNGGRSLNGILAEWTTRTIERRVLLGCTALAALLELLPGLPVLLTAPAGFWLLLGAPTVLWCGFLDKVVSNQDGRVLVAITLSVITDILSALLMNTVLPLGGQEHPLARPQLALGALLAVMIIIWAVPSVTRTNSLFPGGVRGLTTVLVL